MIGRHQRYIRADGYVVTDIDRAVIHGGKVEIGQEVVPDIHMLAVINLHRALETEILSDFAHDFLNDFLPFRIIFVQLVVPLAGSVCLVLDFQQFGICQVKQFTGVDFLFFSHAVYPSFISIIILRGTVPHGFQNTSVSFIMDLTIVINTKRKDRS